MFNYKWAWCSPRSGLSVQLEVGVVFNYKWAWWMTRKEEGVFT